MRQVVGAALAAAALAAGTAQAQSVKDFPDVTDNSFVQANGSKVLKIAIIVPAPREKVWERALTTEGYKAWATPVASVDARLGGVIESAYSTKARLGEPDNIRNQIVLFTPGRAFGIQNITAPASLPGRKEFGDIVTVMEFEDAGPGATRVTLTAVGYKPQEPYLTLYRHFSWGNAYTLVKLRDSFTKGPIDWKRQEAEAEAKAAAAKVQGGR
ncbi:MAG: SRPBCC domain-containing protein [Phenylobacterium sp.]|uniref:SRPBCC family protein n=1 Tax=Phenylobacterium sp. TaxID=1871053 RepID=UPI001A38DEF5|nr:SRPBCC domain-containing protein [Phenylobacterium sp.]MBL8773242.1 SRPBCC domain-containing protein [Phenylobacterium sp.]